MLIASLPEECSADPSTSGSGGDCSGAGAIAAGGGCSGAAAFAAGGGCSSAAALAGVTSADALALTGGGFALSPCDPHAFVDASLAGMRPWPHASLTGDASLAGWSARPAESVGGST